MSGSAPKLLFIQSLNATCSSLRTMCCAPIAPDNYNIYFLIFIDILNYSMKPLTLFANLHIFISYLEIRKKELQPSNAQAC